MLFTGTKESPAISLLLKIIEVLVLIAIGYFFPKIISGIRKFSPKRRRIKKDIELHINRQLGETLKETFGLPVLRYSVSIEWEEKAKPDTYLNEEGDLVIKLSYEKDRNRSRGFVKALMLYLDESFMPEAKPFTGEDIYKGCEFNLAKEIAFHFSAEAYRHFISDYLGPVVIGSQNMEELLNKLELISKKRFFRTLLLRELYLLTGMGVMPREEIREEVEEFINFLWNIANKEEYEKEYGREPPLDFIKNHVKIQIVLVARKDVPYRRHIKRARDAFKNKVKRVYVKGWGSENVEGVEYIAKRLRVDFKQIGRIALNVEFPERIVEGICFIFE